MLFNNNLAFPHNQSVNFVSRLEDKVNSPNTFSLAHFYITRTSFLIILHPISVIIILVKLFLFTSSESFSL